VSHGSGLVAPRYVPVKSLSLRVPGVPATFPANASAQGPDRPTAARTTSLDRPYEVGTARRKPRQPEARSREREFDRAGMGARRRILGGHTRSAANRQPCCRKAHKRPIDAGHARDRPTQWLNKLIYSDVQEMEGWGRSHRHLVSQERGHAACAPAERLTDRAPLLQVRGPTTRTLVRRAADHVGV
jgi:hypothetical protein